MKTMFPFVFVINSHFLLQQRPIKKREKFPFSEALNIFSLRTLPAFDIPVKKLPVTSSRFGSIFDFHCSLTKPPGMLLFKDASPSP